MAKVGGVPILYKAPPGGEPSFVIGISDTLSVSLAPCVSGERPIACQTLICC